MIVDGKALASAMREAFRNSGYEVAGHATENGGYMMIKGPTWIVNIQRKSVDRKVLGLIAEHIGQLPYTGEAWRTNKNEGVQTLLMDVAVQASREIEKKIKNGCAECFERTEITYKGMEVWQSQETMRTVLLSPELTRLNQDHDIPVCVNGDMLVWSDPNGMLAVMIKKTTDENKIAMEFLGQMQWTPGKGEKNGEDF